MLDVLVSCDGQMRMGRVRDQHVGDEAIRGGRNGWTVDASASAGPALRLITGTIIPGSEICR